MNVSVFLNGEKISHHVSWDDFPPSADESLKGPGYFDFDVTPFDVPIKNVITVSKGDVIVIKRVTNGEVLVAGRVDEVSGEASRVLTVTVYPWPIVLKDTQVGTQINLADDDWAPGDEEGPEDDIVRDFDSERTRPMRELIQLILDDVNGQEGTNFFVDEVSCPDPEDDPSPRFFGNELIEVRREGILNKILDTMFLGLGNQFDDSVYLRTSATAGGHVIHHDGGFHRTMVLREGQWLNLSLKKSWTVLGVSFGFDFGSWKVPSNDLYIPLPKVLSRRYECQGGGLDLIEEVGWFPVWPFDDEAPDESHDGPKLTSKLSTQISVKNLNAYAREAGWVSAELKGSWDLDERNTYLQVYVKKWNDVIKGRDMIMSFETLNDFSYRATYRNTSAMAIIRDLAVASDRIPYVDPDQRVWLLPRDTEVDRVDLVRSRVQSGMKSKMTTVAEATLQLGRYEEDQDHKVQSRGLRLRKNELEGLQRAFYKKWGSRVIREREIKILRAPSSLKLLRRVFISGVDHGLVVEIKRGLENKITTIRTEEVINV